MYNINKSYTTKNTWSSPYPRHTHSIVTSEFPSLCLFIKKDKVSLNVEQKKSICILLHQDTCDKMSKSVLLSITMTENSPKLNRPFNVRVEDRKAHPYIPFNLGCTVNAEAS